MIVPAGYQQRVLTAAALADEQARAYAVTDGAEIAEQWAFEASCTAMAEKAKTLPRDNMETFAHAFTKAYAAELLGAVGDRLSGSVCRSIRGGIERVDHDNWGACGGRAKYYGRGGIIRSDDRPALGQPGAGLST